MFRLAFKPARTLGKAREMQSASEGRCIFPLHKARPTPHMVAPPLVAAKGVLSIASLQVAYDARAFLKSRRARIGAQRRLKHSRS